MQTSEPKSYSPVVAQEDFHHMRGHLDDGTQIILPDRSRLIIKATMRGWVVLKDKFPISDPLDSAIEVDRFIYNYGK